jgi:hypothetical protein
MIPRLSKIGPDVSLPLRERKDFLGFSLFAKSLEKPREGV